jgi:cyclopropane fatty-acyl-phospholipid synthase-like methyltransferase
MTTKQSYSIFAKYYDAVMGSRKSDVARVKRWLNHRAPRAKTLVELGCGTGALLEGFAKRYSVTGVDQSTAMLRVAKQRLPRAALTKADMSRYRSKATVDVVLCLFDTINHLLSFREWARLFKNVSCMLSANGVFIFDINTISRLDSLSACGTMTTCLSKNDFALIRVTKTKRKRFSWEIRVFQQTRPGRYSSHREIIEEASFPVERISSELGRWFSHVELLNAEGKRVGTDAHGRVFFVCQR